MLVLVCRWFIWCCGSRIWSVRYVEDFSSWASVGGGGCAVVTDWKKRNFLPLSMCLVRQTGQQATFDFELCSCGRVLIVLQSWTACSDWNQFVGLVCGKYFQPLTKTGIGQTEHIRRYSYEFFYHRILTLHGQFRRKFVAILFYNNHQKNSFPTCDMLFDYSRITFVCGKELYLPSGASVGGGGSAVVTEWKKKGKIVPLSMCPFRETRQTTFSF